MKTRINKTEMIKKIALCGVFSALAYVCVCVFRIKVSFLTLDIKDAVITSAAMIMGPIAGAAISLVVAFLEMITISDTVFYGFIMNFLSSATLSVVASFIYRSRRNLFTAVLGLIVAVFSVTSVMLLANLFITPYYMGVVRGDVVKLIPKLLLPFNLTKAILNSSLVMIIYKPISTALARAKVIKKSSDNASSGYRFNAKTLAVTLASVGVLILCLIVFFFVLNAEIHFF